MLDHQSADVASAGERRALDRFRIELCDIHGVRRASVFKSWAVRERHWNAVTEGLRSIPEGTWTVLGLHSLDDEGAEPWSSAGFARLVAVVSELRFEVVTARGAYERLALIHGWTV